METWLIIVLSLCLNSLLGFFLQIYQEGLLLEIHYFDQWFYPLGNLSRKKKFLLFLLWPWSFTNPDKALWMEFRSEFDDEGGFSVILIIMGVAPKIILNLFLVGIACVTAGIGAIIGIGYLAIKSLFGGFLSTKEE